jgi:hypothetical protein
MSIFSLIFLVIRIMIQLPHMVKVGREVLELIKKFKDGGFINDLEVVLDILKLILGLTKVDKGAAGTYFYALKNTMAGSEAKASVVGGLSSLKEQIVSQHEAFFNNADLVK